MSARDWFRLADLAGGSEVQEIAVDAREHLERFAPCDYCGSLSDEWEVCSDCGGATCKRCVRGFSDRLLADAFSCETQIGVHKRKRQ